MMETFNGRMVELARESRGMTQGALAAGLGASQGFVSKIEACLAVPSVEIVDRIGLVLRYPRTFFFRTDAVYGCGSSCIYHRKRQSIPVGALRTVIANLNVTRMQVSRLLRGVDVENDYAFHRMDVADYPGGPEHIATLLRQNWRLTRGPISNLIGAIEAAGGVVVRGDFGTHKLDAVSQWTPGLPPLFFVNDLIPADRLRFTLAHEVGHLVMHHIPTPDLEREADRFAGEFLMPAQDIRPELRPFSLERAAALKPVWKVSIQALIRRAHSLRVITERQYRSMFTLMSKMGYRKSEPVEIPQEEPTVIADILDVYRRDHGFSVADLCKLIDLTEEEFRQRFLHSPTSKFRIVN